MRRLWVTLVGVVIISLCLVSAEETDKAENQNLQQNQCVKKLMPCVNYLNGSRGPPSTCCDPLKDVIEKMPECLCQMVSISGSKEAEKAGIDTSKAQMLPARCGHRVNFFGCLPPDSDSSSADGHSIQSAKLIKATASIIIIYSSFLWCFGF
ncbi:unnamed protein product [Cuscuta epithymum]|uniref:Bifunctional inhibitor/plant lipid transfer protein/seed storage helical domain-containing protein n=1 Tax=Cuscuta epithymum TaxID=186058 RepID=A0AAV0DXR4_9ASTE|nr:unnamed protein product [Cuscuta epithymum]